MGPVMHIFLPFFGYLLGAVPFGLVVGKVAGIDIRTEGSGNIGATNVSRVLGKKLGLITLVCDCLKGLLPMVIAAAILPEGQERELTVALTGLCAVVGHMFPVYLKFRGGKGVATSLGVFLFLSPPAIAISLAVFVASVAVSGFVSVGSLLTSALMPLWLYLLGASTTSIVVAAAVALLIWLKHHENIDRLRHGREKTWKKAKTE